MNTKMKRQRSKNFTEREEVVLMALVKANQHIIENKKSDGPTWKQKGEAWTNISFKFGRKTGVHRSTQALKAKYECLKKKYKGDFPKEKTGDESQTSTCFSNKSDIYGENTLGSDNPLSDAELSPVQMSQTAFDPTHSTFEPSNVNVQVKLESSETHPVIRDSPNNEWQINYEKQAMLLAKQTFYEQENIRAQERHLAEMELLRIKREKESKEMEILNLELAEKKRAIMDK